MTESGGQGPLVFGEFSSVPGSFTGSAAVRDFCIRFCYPHGCRGSTQGCTNPYCFTEGLDRIHNMTQKSRAEPMCHNARMTPGLQS